MYSSIRTPLLTVLVIFVAFLAYTKIFGPIPFSVNSVTTSKLNLFSVSGTGKATAIPNTAHVSLGVTKTSTTVASAQQEVNSVSNKIIEDLKNLGIEEKNITTAHYSVNPNYDFVSGRQNITGYTVTQNLEIKIIPIERANSAIDIATRSGANLVGGVQFVLDDKTKKETVQKARIEAVKEAKEKANSLADISGIRLGRIVDIQETTDPRDIMPLSLESKNTGGEPTQLSPGENTTTVTITLYYETY